MKNVLVGIGLLSIGLTTSAQEKETKFEIKGIQKLGCEVYQVVFNPTNQKVYVAGPQSGNNRDTDHFIYELDGRDLRVTDSISVGKNHPFGIALNNKTQTLYVGHSRDNAVSAIDIGTKKLAVIRNGKEKSKIREIVVDESDNKVYVSDHGNPSIWQIDGKTNTYDKSFDHANAYLLGLSVDSGRQRVYGTDGQDMRGNILVFDTKSGKLQGEYQTWSYCPLNIALDLKGARIFVSQSNDNNVTVLNANTGEIINKVYLGYDTSPIGLVYDEKNNLLYTANRGKQEVAIIDVENYAIIDRIETKGLPNTISLDQETGAVYVTNKQAGRKGDPVENANTVIKISKN